jgi:hypothetical protein
MELNLKNDKNTNIMNFYLNDCLYASKMCKHIKEILL